jgi:hypothetical protein
MSTFIIKKETSIPDVDGEAVIKTEFDDTYYDNYNLALDCCRQWALDDCPPLKDGYHCDLTQTSTHDAIVTDITGCIVYKYTILKLVRASVPDR